MRFLFTATTVVALLSLSTSLAQRPLRTSGVSVGEPENEQRKELEGCTIQLAYSYVTESRGYTTIDFYFNCSASVYMWNSTFKLLWNTKALQFESFTQDKKRVKSNLRASNPNTGLRANLDYWSDEKFLVLNTFPAQSPRRTLLDGEYYIGTVKFKSLNKEASHDFRLEGFSVALYNNANADISKLTEFDSQELE